MKQRIISIAAALAIVGLAGCATARNDSMAANDDVDYAKVQAINNAAKVTGLQVKWINYPVKKEAVTGS